jgi:hypothetical protein
LFVFAAAAAYLFVVISSRLVLVVQKWTIIFRQCRSRWWTVKKEASFYLIVFYCLNYLLLRLAGSCPDFLHRCFVVVPSRKGGFSLRCVCVFVDREECLEGITVIPRGEGFREREREREKSSSLFLAPILFSFLLAICAHLLSRPTELPDTH